MVTAVKPLLISYIGCFGFLLAQHACLFIDFADVVILHDCKIAHIGRVILFVSEQFTLVFSGSSTVSVKHVQ